MPEWKTLTQIQTQRAHEIDLREWLRMVADGLLDVHRRLEQVEREVGFSQK